MQAVAIFRALHEHTGHGNHVNGASLKKPVSIRLSSSVVDYFRSTGKGWQTRVDDILSQYVKNHAK